VTYRKKLIEVALPLEAINKASAKEKSIRHGHPSTLHLWWARRPLAACRAVLFASLVDDPDSDPMFAGDEDIAVSKRAELFNLIEELVLWENSNNSRVINRARAEIARCVATQKIEEGVFKKDEVLSLAQVPQRAGVPPSGGKNANTIRVSVFEIRQLLAKPEQVDAFPAEHAPPVLNPFCGGESIPLEAQRLGLRAYASDLNPVPVLITKALIEIPPKFAGLPPVNPEWRTKSKEEKAATVWQGAHGLAEDVRHYGKWMRDEAEERIGHLYPKVKITKEDDQEPAGAEGIRRPGVDSDCLDLGQNRHELQSRISGDSSAIGSWFPAQQEVRKDGVDRTGRESCGKRVPLSRSHRHAISFREEGY
jgi:putative DNA methylase